MKAIKTSSPTTKDIALLLQLHRTGQLKLMPEFQRESIWPFAAKSYLIDTILNNKPIPIFFIQRDTSLQTGRSEYAVIDGQQRLRAIFGYIEDEFALSEMSPASIAIKHKSKKFSQLPSSLQQMILNYDLVIQELSGYSDEDVRDIFERINKYNVKLSKSEQRHAQMPGKFKDLVETIGKWTFWKNHKILSESQLKRMKATEYAAELIILLAEGAQNKKKSVDLYYKQYKEKFPEGDALKKRLDSYLQWLDAALPNLSKSRFRRSSELYALIGALDKVTNNGKKLSSINVSSFKKSIIKFEEDVQGKKTSLAADYLIAASRHTDDIGPRTARIEILSKLF